MRRINAIYRVTDSFHIPDDIPLLSTDENYSTIYGEAWSWYIKYGLLYYFDKDLKEHEIKPCSVGDCDKKYPRDVDDEKEEEDSNECIYFNNDCLANKNAVPICYRCARKGHLMDTCCEKKNISGDYID